MTPPLILDTQLLLLLATGLTRRDYIQKHRRLAKYDAVDFDIVGKFVEESSALVLTPNVLSETSNLVRYVRDPIRTEISRVLTLIVRKTEERYIASRLAVERREVHRLGITDTTLLLLAESGGTLLTDDLDLYLAAMQARLRAINYSHLREQRPDFR